ncbi:MAG TPA: twin-arginine translocation signal domain-containing protein [Thermomicrobiales bacterium]|nr:twin-arginine translocation signal domain-containing protein [Thermomicrobiales bacterium]
MTQMNRRSFLKLAGSGPVLVAAGSLPVMGALGRQEAGALRFRAAAGLPEPPLPAYATQVVEGSLDLARGTGLVTSRVLAGHPGAPSEVGLPGLTRVIRVVDIAVEGGALRLLGLIEDRSQLRPGESPRVELLVDRARGVVQAPFAGRPLAHRLV